MKLWKSLRDDLFKIQGSEQIFTFWRIVLDFIQTYAAVVNKTSNWN